MRHMLLERLGLPRDSIYTGEVARDGRIFVRALIEGETAILTVSTGMRIDVRLERSYAERRGFPIEWRRNAFGVCPTGEFVVLGRQRRFDTAVVGIEQHEGKAHPTFAGAVGTMFFNDGLLAIDQASGEIARVDRADSVRERLPAPTFMLPLLPGTDDRTAFTSVIAVEDTDGPLTFQLASGRGTSLLSDRVIGRSRSRRAASRYKDACATTDRLDVPLVLPGETMLEQSMFVRDWVDTHARQYGLDAFDGILGADFLRRWITVFDYPAGRLLLYDYGLALPALERK
jgi:hypothetical protein